MNATSHTADVQNIVHGRRLHTRGATCAAVDRPHEPASHHRGGHPCGEASARACSPGAVKQPACTPSGSAPFFPRLAAPPARSALRRAMLLPGAAVWARRCAGQRRLLLRRHVAAQRAGAGGAGQRTPLGSHLTEK
eukprot:scaffold131205_cov75-Phaeocystis_antarctica.AAC.1